jgi:hypothetical protein
MSTISLRKDKEEVNIEDDNSTKNVEGSLSGMRMPQSRLRRVAQGRMGDTTYSDAVYRFRPYTHGTICKHMQIDMLLCRYGTPLFRGNCQNAAL